MDYQTPEQSGRIRECEIGPSLDEMIFTEANPQDVGVAGGYVEALRGSLGENQPSTAKGEFAFPNSKERRLT
jgi:hypothetical protein